MAHIYMTFDFGTDEEKAQQARHKLDVWKQAFRLDKKLIYKFERAEAEGVGEDSDHAETDMAAEKKEAAKAERTARGSKAKSASGKGKAAKEKREESAGAETPASPVKLHLRLAFSGHEKMTEERWLKRIPTEEPFKSAEPEMVKDADPGFGEIEGKFEALEG